MRINFTVCGQFISFSSVRIREKCFHSWGSKKHHKLQEKIYNVLCDVIFWDYSPHFFGGGGDNTIVTKVHSACHV